MLVWGDEQNGGQAGTIGGGALEYQATQAAREMLDTGERRWFTRAILGPDMGQCCGGAVALLYERYETAPEVGTVFARPVEEGAPRKRAEIAQGAVGLKDGWFIEPVTPAPVPVWIWGAGHVGRAIARVLAPLPGLAVTWIDTAPERFPDPLPDGIAQRVAPEIADAVAQAPVDAHHFILTFAHDFDFALCDALLGHGFESAGLIGSATKWARFRSRLGQNGHAAADIDRIRCPIGTPALGRDPGIIAVGVAHALLMDLAKKRSSARSPDKGTG
jgi:xanthine dehydrogenase accessory factor